VSAEAGDDAATVVARTAALAEQSAMILLRRLLFTMDNTLSFRGAGTVPLVRWFRRDLRRMVAAGRGGRRGFRAPPENSEKQRTSPNHWMYEF